MRNEANNLKPHFKGINQNGTSAEEDQLRLKK